MSTARDIFARKGGNPKNEYPRYMVVGECKWLEFWYDEGAFTRVHISEFPSVTISFSYGDLFPTLSARVNDRKECRSQVYTLEEMVAIIRKYGLPQAWNVEGRLGPERYVEAQIWDDEPLARHLTVQKSPDAPTASGIGPVIGCVRLPGRKSS